MTEATSQSTHRPWWYRLPFTVISAASLEART